MINDTNKIRPTGICSHSTCSSLNCSLWISHFYHRNVLMFPQNKTACQHWKNYLTIISKTMRRSNANCVDLNPPHTPRSLSSPKTTPSKCLRVNQMFEGGESRGPLENKKPIEEQRRTTLSHERQTQLPTTPLAVSGWWELCVSPSNVSLHLSHLST